MTVMGVANSQNLLEDIPNKVWDLLSILVDVHSRTEGEHTYLKTVVEDYPYPISYNKAEPLTQWQHQARA
jgi:ATP-dependent DNA helicase RecG